jgi:hypothetical protein
MLALAASAAMAQTYKVEIRPTLDDVNIKVDHVDSSGVLTLILTNIGELRARCELMFDASPQVPYRTTVFVDPGKDRSVVFRAKRKWFNVVVDVNCEPDKK